MQRALIIFIFNSICSILFIDKSCNIWYNFCVKSYYFTLGGVMTKIFTKLRALVDEALSDRDAVVDKTPVLEKHL